MAQPTNTFDTYDAIGIREDLSDIIYNISPTDTPFMTTAKKEQAENILFEWQTDALATAANNKQIDGDDATGTALVATVRLPGRTQISRKVIIISGLRRLLRKLAESLSLLIRLPRLVRRSSVIWSLRLLRTRRLILVQLQLPGRRMVLKVG
jgi:hypothetical protein